MSNPLVTIVTVVLNDSVNIISTIESVLSQTYNNIEYIVIDGDSRDGTQEVIRRYEKRITQFISEPDKGIYDAMNKGTMMASGQWITYMNSGDIFSSNTTLEKIFDGSENDISGSDIIYSDVIADYKTSRKIRAAKKLSFFWHGLPFSHQSHLVRASYAKSKLFNLNYRICADFDFMYSSYKTGAIFYYINFPIAIVDVTQGISKNVNLILLYKEYLKVCRNFSSFSELIITYVIVPPEFTYAIIRSTIRKIVRKGKNLFIQK